MPPGIIHRLYPGGSDLFDAYCRTLCADKLGTQYSPPLPHFTGLHEGRDALRCTLDGVEISVKPCSAAFMYLDFIWNFCKGRSFFTTTEGYIGHAPKAAQLGDQVVGVLGCPSPMLLRPNGARHQVVGECYICELMNGEAALGPLPSRHQATLLFDKGMDKQSEGSLDLETGLVQRDDPRIDAMGYGAKEKKSVRESWGTKPADLRLTATIMKDRGMKLREFELA